MKSNWCCKRRRKNITPHHENKTTTKANRGSPAYPIYFMRTFTPRNTRDRSVTHSLKHRVSTKSSASQLLQCVPNY